MRPSDVLDLAAREHRELNRAVRRLLHPRGCDTGTLTSIVSSVARHEAMDRLLLYPLVGRDGDGRRSLIERRAEQRSLSDQLALAIRTAHTPGTRDLDTVLGGLRLTFVGHSDREEIEDFPQARRLSSPEERARLGDLRWQLRDQLIDRLPEVPASAPHPNGNESLGPVQLAIVRAKEILADLDRSNVPVA